MREIRSREDIEFLVDTFYKKVLDDEVIGYIFTEVAKLDWDSHMPVMYDFWETMLLGNMLYKGNPMLKHIALDQKEKLTAQHFDRWIQLWRETLENHFTGEKATEAIQRAEMMRQLMQYKIEQSRNQHFIQ
ncbi:MAG TPA: group III truncated hemoglobin [Saprospiraceae bacterium]|nr:group III truncated hemoglobin [Saprospiraceae bacterium]